MKLFQCEFVILVEVKCKPDQSCPNLGLHLLKGHLPAAGNSQKSSHGLSERLIFLQSYTHHTICVQVGKFHQCHQFKVWHRTGHVPLTWNLVCIKKASQKAQVQQFGLYKIWGTGKVCSSHKTPTSNSVVIKWWVSMNCLITSGWPPPLPLW